MTLLRSLAFNLLFCLWAALAQLAGLPCLLLPARTVYRAGALWVRGVFALLAIAGIGYRVRGLEHRMPGPAIYAAKHQSAWDTMVFALLLDRPAMVVKQELMWLPVFGWYLRRAGMIPVDRAAGAKALRRMTAAAERVVAQGRPIVIYPEGTRAAPGERLPYRPGVAALYRRLGLPVVPVALNSGLFWGRRSFLKRPGTITLEFLPAIPPGLERHAFMERLESEIETAAARLAAAPLRV